MYGTVLQSPKITQEQTAKIATEILTKGLKPPFQYKPYYVYVNTPKTTIKNVDEYLPGDW
jgi:hypothetical protein